MKRNLYLLLLLTCISMICSTLLEFALSFHVLDTTRDPKKFTLILIITMISGCIASPIVGHYVDRLNKKYMIIFAEFVAITTLTVYYLNAYLLASITGIAILNIILAIAGSINMIVLQSDMKTLVGEVFLENYVIYNRIVSRVMIILTPMLGGILYSLSKVNFIIFLALFLEFISLILIIILKFETHKTHKIISTNNKKTYFIISFKDVIKVLNQHSLLKFLFITSFLINFLFSFLTIGEQTSIVTVFNLSASNIGFIGVFVSIGTILTSLSIKWLNKKGYNQFYYISFFLMGVTVCINIIPFFILSKYVIVFLVIGSFVGGVASTLYSIPSSIYQQLILPEEIKGKYFSIDNALNLFLIPLGYAISGIIYSNTKQIYIYVYLILIIIIFLSIVLVRNFPFQKLYNLAIQKDK